LQLVHPGEIAYASLLDSYTTHRNQIFDESRVLDRLGSLIRQSQQKRRMHRDKPRLRSEQNRPTLSQNCHCATNERLGGITAQRHHQLGSDGGNFAL
jgi:hypothetical protein